MYLIFFIFYNFCFVAYQFNRKKSKILTIRHYNLVICLSLNLLILLIFLILGLFTSSLCVCMSVYLKLSPCNFCIHCLSFCVFISLSLSLSVSVSYFRCLYCCCFFCFSIKTHHHWNQHQFNIPNHFSNDNDNANEPECIQHFTRNTTRRNFESFFCEYKCQVVTKHCSV